MKTLPAMLSLAFFLSGLAPIAVAAPHSHTNKVKASKRKPYKMKRAKVHRAQH